MNTFKVLVDIDEKLAILEGQDQFGHTTFNIKPSELDPLQREALASLTTQTLDDSSDKVHNLYYANASGCRFTKISHVNKEIVIQLLKEQYDYIQKEEKEEKENLAKKLKELKESIETNLTKSPQELKEERQDRFNWIHKPSSLWTTRSDNETLECRSYDEIFKEHFTKNYTCDWDQKLYYKVKKVIEETYPELCQKLKDRLVVLEAWCVEENAETKRQMDLKIEERAERNRQDEADKADQFNQWVLELGSTTQKKKHERKLLDENEVLALARAELFNPFDGFDKYRKITYKDISDADPAPDEDYHDGNGPEVQFATDRLHQNLLDEEFLLMEEIEKKVAKQLQMGKATVELIRHVGGWKGERTWSVEKNSVVVKISVKGWDFTRHYGLGEVRPYDS